MGEITKKEIKCLKNFLRLEMAIKTKQDCIITTTEKDKCIGKTYSLVELALEYNLPIIVPSLISMRYVKELARKEFGKELRRVIVLDSASNMREIYFGTFLIDEGVKKEFVDELFMNCKHLIGYIYQE